jgi:hypothetical protein
MDLRVRGYLMRAHNKVIAHCRQVLQASYVSERQRMRIQQTLVAVEADLENLEHDATPTFAEGRHRLAA